MQTFENLILQNCSTKFYDIAHTCSLGMCNCLFKWWCHLDFSLCDYSLSSGYNVKLYNIIIIVHYNV